MDIPAKEYEFFPNKVNVITGDSSTGKSSILSVIDYCLLASESNIVEEVINANVEWYGLSFHLNQHEYVIARRNPNAKDADMNLYFAEAEDFPLFFEPNTTRGDLVVLFNELLKSPQREYNLTDNIVKTDFRCFLPVNYLTEDSIATQNTYFDTKFFKEPDLEAILSEIIKMAIGIDERRKDDLERRQKLLKEKIEEEDKKRERVSEKVAEFDSKLSELWQRTIDLGINTAVQMPNDYKSVLVDIDRALKIYDDLFNSKEQFRHIKELKSERTKIKRSLDKCKSLRDDIQKYNEYLANAQDSLLPIEYLYKHLDDVVYCEDTRLLVDNLISTLSSVKKQTAKPVKVPKDLTSHIEDYTLQYNSLTEKIRQVDAVVRRTMDVDWLINVLKLKQDYEALTKPHRGIMSEPEYLNLQQEYRSVCHNLETLVSNKEEVLRKFNETIQAYFGVAHGLSDAYNGCQAYFELRHHALYLKREGEERLITNVGSKCNYMFMHLCTFLGLHEHIIRENIDFIPSFMFIDQPSIPFYADKSEDDIEDNDDKKRLGYAFNLINIFMERICNYNYKHPFQIILVEHANPSYWVGKYPTFETRYEFVKGKDSGLIPDNVYRRP